MAIERALVLETRDEQALVRTQRKSACQACELESSCGQGLLSKVGADRTMEVWVDNYLNANPGQVVSISIPDEGLLAASAVMFLLPLTIMIGASALAFAVFGDELSAIIGGFAGLAVGFFFARHQSNTMESDERFKPTMESLQLNDATEGACSRSD